MSSAIGSADDVGPRISGKSHPSTAAIAMRIAVCGVIAGLLVAMHRAYRANQPVLFFAGFGAILTVTAGWLRRESPDIVRFGWPAWQRFAASVLMLGLIEVGYRTTAIWPSIEDAATETSWKALTFAEAKDDPAAYAKWWKAYQAEWYRHPEQILTFTPGGPVPYLFKPNTSRPFFQGTININSLGLADKERPLEKGDKFRIVVMGSSHSQGLPLEAGDTPWPEKLERLIHERVPNGRQMEVINAGAGAYTMENNLHRLQHVVLPLKPDMIITYFGANEFHWFRKEFALPKIPPSPIGQRASTVIKKLDERYAQWWSSFGKDPAPIADYGPLEERLRNCKHARCYREYLEICRSAGIQLVVCNFSMAVDERSPKEVIDFYATSFPNVKFMIEANRLNSALLPVIVRPETGARLIDVQRDLHGKGDELFVDLIHPSDRGHLQLAENVFRGIVDLLPPSPGNPSERSPTRLVDRPDANTLRN